VSGWLFTRLDWLIAWRHLRGADALPAWVRPLIIGSLYLIAVGAALAWHASTLEVPPSVAEVGSLTVFDMPFEPLPQDTGPTPLARYYGAFGGFTLLIGVMTLVFGLLSWFFNLLPTMITMSVLLGCMALVVVLSLMSGLEGDLRDKILNQKAHIRVSREDARPFGDYHELAEALAQARGVAGASPYLEGEIMVRSGLNRQGAILSGIVPELQAQVSNLPTLIREGSWSYLEHPEEIPEPDPFAFEDSETPWRLRHLEEQRKRAKEAASQTGPAHGDAKLDPIPENVEDRPGIQLGPGGDALRGALEPDEDDGEWEDPAEELAHDPGDPGDPGDTGDAGDRDPPRAVEWSPRLADRLPPPPDPDVELDDGWEDPAEEIRRLREDGVLPPAPDPPEDAEPRPSEIDPDDDWEADVTIDPILIGRELSMELGVRVGTQVQLITPIGRMTPAGRIPGVLGARVGGIFFSGMYEYDRKNVYAPLSVVQRFLLTGDRVSGIEIKLENVEKIDAGKAAVLEVVERLGRSDELMVEDWRDLNRNLFSAMFLEKVAMFIALLFVVLVASFGILASNLMSVMEKAKEIAILKAMGTSDRGILRVFIAEGLCVGILGSFGGIAMGLGLCWALDRYGLPLNENVYYIEKLPVVVNPAEVALVGVAALVIVCISSLYPALVASRLRPVDALRHADQ
jgi:ABC-type lipoprotein release transport system permease subunit